MDQQDKNSSSFWDFWGPILISISLYSGIRHYIAEARYIPSGSMLPGLKVNDRLLIEKLTFRNRSPRRGEIVVFNSPFSFDPLLRRDNGPSPIKCAVVNFPLIALISGFGDRACDAYIKRVVAVSGDDVVVNAKGEVTINGNLTREPYVTSFCKLSPEGLSKCLTLNEKVPFGHVLVLGDNRRNSWDGRFWPGGAFLPEKEIIGRAVWRFWPFNRWGLLDS